MGTHNMGKGKKRKRLNVNYPKGNHKGQTLRPAGKGATSRRMTNLQASQKTGDTCRKKKASVRTRTSTQQQPVKNRKRPKNQKKKDAAKKKRGYSSIKSLEGYHKDPQE